MKKNKDIKRGLEFHIKNNDYFSNLATSLSLISQSLSKEDKKFKEVLNDIVEELIYLNNHYSIEKPRKINSDKQGRVKSDII